VRAQLIGDSPVVSLWSERNFECQRRRAMLCGIQEDGDVFTAGGTELRKRSYPVASKSLRPRCSWHDARPTIEVIRSGCLRCHAALPASTNALGPSAPIAGGMGERRHAWDSRHDRCCLPIRRRFMRASSQPLRGRGRTGWMGPGVALADSLDPRLLSSSPSGWVDQVTAGRLPD